MKGLGMTEAEARKLLHEHGQGQPWTRHCDAVARVATAIAEAAAPAVSLDVPFVLRAALLHDLGRCRTHDPLRHGAEGYHLLTALGHHREAAVCVSHVLAGLPADLASGCGLPARDFLPETWEEKLVPLADFLVERDLATTLDARFASLRRRNQEHGEFLRLLAGAEARTRAFTAEVENAVGIRVEDLASRALLSGE